MVRRTLTAALLLLILIPSVYVGGIAFLGLAAVFLGIAAWEYGQMLKLKQHETAPIVVIGAVLLILAARQLRPELAELAFALSILIAVAVHLFRFERGRAEAAVDLAASVTGIAYLGWVGAYLLDLRSLPDGLWWLILVLATVWVADSSAYFVGVRYGRHKMAPRLSPKKSWEGYGAGVIAGTTFAALFSSALVQIANLDVGLLKGAGLGLLLSTVTTLGDLAESMFKRYVGVKDSGSFLPGHGGAFDRIDSLIWAGVLGYYWITIMP